MVADDAGANTTVPIEVFVTGSLANRLPKLVNPEFLPAHPVDGDLVSIQVTYYDADDDLPVLLEVVIDGAPHSLEPVNLYDINATDGKDYVYRTTLAAGHHTVIFRVNDGFAGHADLAPIATSVDVAPDSLRQLDNWFLALFASVALMLVLMIYFAATAKPKAKPAREPEDDVKLIEGPGLKPIDLPKKPAAEASAREDELEREADELAEEAAKDEREAKAVVDDAKKH